MTSLHEPELSTAQNRAALPRNVKLLGWASCLNDVASEMIFPLLPLFLTSVLGGSKRDLGLIEGAADTTSNLLKLGMGAWSDRLRHRRMFVVVGYLLSAVARPLASAVGAPVQLLAVRLADRFGKGIRTAPRDALIADSVPHGMHGRAFGFHQAMDHVGAAAGPVLAAVFLAIWPGHLRMLFLMSIVPGLVVVAILMLGLRESWHAPPAEIAQAPPPAAGFHRSMWLFLLAVTLFTLGNSSDAFLLVRAGELGISPAQISLLWSVFHVVKSAGNHWGGRIADRYGPRGPLLLGWLLYAAVYAGFGLAAHAWQILALFLVYSVFYALTEPTQKALVARLVTGDQRGRAFGAYHFAVGLSGLPSGLLCGWLYDAFGPAAAFGVGGALAIAAAAVLAAVSEHGRVAPTAAK